MKKTKIFLLFIATVFLVVSCFEEESEIIHSSRISTFPEITSINSSFFEYSDLSGAYIEFVVDVDQTMVNSITIEKTFAGNVTQLETYSSFPATVRITSAEAVGDIDTVDIADLELGDVFSFQILVNEKSGLTSRSNELLNASVACASDLTGTYNCVANGTSTDSGPTENPAVNFEQEITLTETDVNGVYDMDDFAGGLWYLWYDIYDADPLNPGQIQDICGTVSYINTFGYFGSPISGGGSVDPVTGVITIEGVADWWGDEWTIVLTPQ